MGEVEEAGRGALIEARLALGAAREAEVAGRALQVAPEQLSQESPRAPPQQAAPGVGKALGAGQLVARENPFERRCYGGEVRLPDVYRARREEGVGVADSGLRSRPTVAQPGCGGGSLIAGRI